MMALADQVVARGGGPVRELVVVEVHRPAGAVGDAVVVAAQRDEIREVGRAAFVPVEHVMVVAPVDGGVAAGEGAATVADRDGAALGDGGEPVGVADIDGDAHVVDHHGPQIRVAAPHVRGGSGDGRAVWVGDLTIVQHQGDLGTG